jgi:YD repeat-containing protein
VVNSAESNATIVFTAVNPVITSLSPPASPVGGSVVVNGSGFFGNQGNGDQVKFNGVTASIASWSDTSITAIVPASATSGPVTVTARNVTSSGVSFIVGAQPAITSIFPTVGPVGSSVTVTGSGFGASQSNSTLSFNGTLSAITSWSDTSIVAVVQAGTASGPVSVVVAGVTTQGPAFSINATYQVTDSLGNQSSYTTSVAGGKWYVTDAQGSGCSSCTQRGNVHNVYDSFGNITSRTDELGHTSSYIYDAANNLTSESVPLDGSTTATTS